MSKGLGIRIFGKVQGVGLRETLRQHADELGISGFAKNESDGSVYVEAMGEESQILRFVEFIKNSPGWSEVSSFEQNELPFREMMGFERV